LDSFIFSVNTALPILLMVLVGMALRRVGILSSSMVAALDQFAFRVGLPLLMFQNVSTMDLYAEFQLRFALYCVGISLASFLVIWFLAPRIFHDRAMAGSFAQGSVRGSVAVLGVAIVSSIYGQAGIAALMVACSVPVYNIMSVLILSSCGGKSAAGGSHVRNAVRGILYNPLILGVLAGMPFALLRIHLPAGITGAISGLGGTATPLSMVVIGASFNWADATARLRPAIAGTIIKILLLPAIGLPIAIALGFRDAALASVLLMLGSGSAPAGYIMAKNLGCDGPLAANIILLTDLLFPLTLTMWLFLLRSSGLI
jgi:predicted permease